jgi:glutamyl-tRNA synthetase
MMQKPRTTKFDMIEQINMNDLNSSTKSVPRGRFAPSPTGEMHLGNARTALLAWLQIRELGGQFVLRLENLDFGRVRPGADDLILEDLAWLGLDWDEGWDVGGKFAPYRQSERLEFYQAAAAKLETYPCTCSRKEVLESASARHAEDEPRYPGTCSRGVTHPERQSALRFRIPDKTTTFQDLFKGTVSDNPNSSVGDFVIRRNDGVWAYQLVCAVDELEMQISHVLRGDDLIQSTARQILLIEALGGLSPQYVHVPLMNDYRGQRLAKRAGAPSINALRESGVQASDIVRDLAASLGWKVTKPCHPRDLIGFFSLWLEQHHLI